MSTESAVAEAVVQLAPDSTGKKVRNLLVLVPNSDGTTSQAYMQVVGLADPDGFPVPDPVPVFQELLGVLASLKESVDLLREELS